MANIPTIVEPQEAEHPQMSPQQAGAAGAARASAFEALESTAFYGAHVALVLQNAQDKVDYDHLESQYRGALQNKLEQYQQNPNYRDFGPDGKIVKEDEEAIRTDFLNNPIVKNNPRLQSRFQPTLDEYFVGLNKATHNLYMKGLQRDGTVRFDETVRQTEQDMASFPPGSPEREAIQAKYNASKNEFLQGFLVNPEHVAEKEEKMQENVQEARILGHIKSNDPLMVQQGIDMLDNPKESDHINPKMNATYKATGEDRLERLKNKLDGDLVMNTSHEYLDKYKDPTIALAKFNSDEEKQTAIGYQNSEHVRSWLRGQQEDVKMEQEKVSGDISKNVFEQIKGGHLFKASEMLTANKGVFTKGDYEVLENAITSEQKWEISEKRERRTEARSIAADEREKRRDEGEAIFGHLMTRIMKGDKLNPIQDIYSQVPKGLSSTNAQLLASVNDDKKDADYKLAINVIDDAYNNKVVDAAKRGNMILKLDDRRRKENLTGKALIDAANEIVNPETKSAFSKILDKIDFWSDKGKKEPSTAPVKSKSGRDMWKWPDGKYHYSAPQATE